MPTNSESSRSAGGRPSKVVQVIDEYDLSTLGDELEHRWTAPANERESLRDLATYVNQQVLRQAMIDAGVTPLEGEVENLYRLLTADDARDGSRTQAERRLEHKGVDVETLRDRFVSYQAVRTYLQNYRNAEYERPDRDRIEADTDALRRVAERTEAIARNKLDRLQDSGVVSVGDVTISAPIRVLCTDCGSRFDIKKLLARGSCDCP